MSLLCEFCHKPVNVFEYMSLSSNPRYSDALVYIAHIDCEVGVGAEEKIIEISETLKLVEVSYVK